MALFALDGPSAQDLIAVTNVESEAKVGASVLEERKVITIQPQDGDVRVLFVSGLASNHGIEVSKGDIFSFEASASQPVYLITDSGTTNVVLIERA